MAEGLTWRAAAGVGRSAGLHLDDSQGVSEKRLLGVWERTLPGLTRLVAGMGCGAGAGEDVLQDVYLSALRSGAGRLEPHRLTRWLFRVAINRCRQEHRKRARFRRALTNLSGRKSSSCAADAFEQAATKQQLQAVAEALSMLEDELKTPLVMRYSCEMDCKEIARVLGLPDSTVRSRLRTGRMRLAKALRKAGHGRE